MRRDSANPLIGGSLRLLGSSLGRLSLLALSAIAFSSPALCQDPNPERIRLVTGPNFAPFASEELPGGGLFTEIVREAFKKCRGQEPIIEFQPWKRGYAQALKGEIFHGAFPYIKNPEREADFLFSNAVITTPTKLFLKAKHRTELKTKEQLRGLTVCTPFDFAVEPLIREALREGLIKLAQPRGLASCFRMLSVDRVDVVAASEDVGWQELKKTLGTSDGYKAAGNLGDQSLYLIVSKKRKDAEPFIAAFNAALRTLDVVALKKKFYLNLAAKRN